MKPAPKTTTRPLALLAIAAAITGMFLLAGCEEKHEPVKPTVAATSPAASHA